MKIPSPLVVMFLPLLACSGQGAPAGGPPGARPPMAFPVAVAPVEARTVEYVIHGVGAVEAFERVQVTARVAGVVEDVSFVEGDQVGPGEVLVKLETDRFEQAVKAAEGARMRVEAGLQDAQASLARRQAALAASPGIVSQEEIETLEGRIRSLEADRVQADAAEEQARLNLRDATIEAPLPGVIETRTVQTGQYVQPGTVLATLTRRDPLMLRFTVREDEARQMEVGAGVRFMVKGSEEVAQAHVSHISGTADPTTRMVTVLARIGSGADTIRPGAFAQVVVPTAAREDAPVIPQTAVRPSERGFLAFVVEGEQARERRLTLGLRTEDGMVEVKSGLEPGEILVVRGAEPLKEGSAVAVSAPAAEQAPAAGASTGAPAAAAPAPGAGEGRP